MFNFPLITSLCNFGIKFALLLLFLSMVVTRVVEQLKIEFPKPSIACNFM